MTWQRIDENTYIDDSLVTSAEYQLFIDEMCTYDHYYQPSHWNSYQFPEGYARDPIVGVHFSDLDEFCMWLTERETGHWVYQMPTFDEARNYPLSKYKQSPLGYWCKRIDGEPAFAWVSDAHANPRNIDFDVIASTFPHRAILARNWLNLSVRPVLYAIDINYDREPTYDVELELSRAIDNHLGKIASATFESAREHERITMIEIYLDLLTLQDRIAGRSPAFEGIRLVKERIR